MEVLPAVDYALRLVGSTQDVGVVVRCETPRVTSMEGQIRRSQELARRFPAASIVSAESQHELHALSALYMGPFTECAVLIVDGAGSIHPSRESLHECASIYDFQAGKLKLVYREYTTQEPYDFDSETIGLGRLYSYASKHIFGSRYDAGKVMGLAALGDASLVPSFLGPDPAPGQIGGDSLRGFCVPIRGGRDILANRHLAARVQRDIELGMLFYARLAKDLTGQANLCIAGGVGLNCPANSAVEGEGIFEDIYIMPAATDDGVAVGAAALGTPVWPTGKPADGLAPFLGGSCDLDSLSELATRAQDVGLKPRRLHEGDVVPTLVDLLCKGDIVGWFRGRSEFGPRALGHRSIIALPSSNVVKERINAEIKLREFFQPIAPMIRLEECSRFLDVPDGWRSAWMLKTAPSTDELRELAPAVVHYDGTVRAQSVTFESDPLAHSLLSELDRLIGCGVVTNTSLNGPGEPICETPEEALDFALRHGLDALLIEDLLITRHHA